jgi:hypothetical protein
MPVSGGRGAPDTAAPGVAEPGPERACSPRGRTGRDTPWLVALALVGGGIAVHAVRAVVGGWIPAADDGYWAIMARSVFSSHPPLLGSSSSGGLTSGTGFHHLGPIAFYVLAPFVAVLGGVGVAVGAAGVNAASAVFAGIVVRDGVGPRAGWVALVGSAALALTMGSELLVDPWNPHLAVLPFWFGLCGSWAVLRGATRWAAPTLFALWLAVQTHLSFAPLGVLVAAVTLAATARWCWVEARRAGGTPGRAWNPLAWALAVSFVANLPVLVQQFFGAGPGNVTAVLEGGNDQGAAIGVGAGLGLVSQPLLQVWNWGPGSWRHHVVGAWELAPPWPLALVVAVSGGLFWWAVRRRRIATAVDLVHAGWLLAVGSVVATTLPYRLFGAPMSLARWIWPVALFVQVVVLVAALDLWKDGRGGERPRWAAGGLVVVALLTLWNVPARDEGSGAAVQSHDVIAGVIDDAADDLGRIERPYVPIPWNRSANDATVAVLDWFDERRIPFSLDDPVALRQAGAHRSRDGSETATVMVRGGAEVLDEPPQGFTTVAERNVVPERDSRWYLGQLDDLESRLVPFRQRLATEPGFQEALGVGSDAPSDTASLAWYALLCMSQTALPTGSAIVQAELISDGDRARLCRIEDRFAHGAVSIGIGPPPTG